MSHDRDVYNCKTCGLQIWDNNGECPPNCPKRYVAQEGGDHYQSEYGHWDWVSDIDMGYLPGNATKYVARWRKKNGVTDLKKALTYVDKMIAILKVKLNYEFNRRPSSYTNRVCTDRFIETNNLTGAERSVMEILSGPCPEEMLWLARKRILDLIQDAQNAPDAFGGMGQGKAAMGLQGGPQDVSSGAGHTATQPPAASASTDGMEHPFGYDEEQENGK